MTCLTMTSPIIKNKCKPKIYTFSFASQQNTDKEINFFSSPFFFF